MIKQRPLFLPLVMIFALALWLAGSVQAQVSLFGTTRSVQVVDAAGNVVLTGGFILIDDDDYVKVGDKFEVELKRFDDDDIDGLARVYFDEDDGEVHEIKVNLDDLSPNSNYQLFVDGRSLVTFDTDDEGDAEIEWEND